MKPNQSLDLDSAQEIVDLTMEQGEPIDQHKPEPDFMDAEDECSVVSEGSFVVPDDSIDCRYPRKYHHGLA